MVSLQNWKWILGRAKRMSMVFWGLALPCLIVTTLWRWNDGLNQTRDQCDQLITEATTELQARLMSLRERVSHQRSSDLEPRLLSRISFKWEAAGWKLSSTAFNERSLRRVDLNLRNILKLSELPAPDLLDNRFWFERRTHSNFEIAHFGWKTAKSKSEEATFVAMISDDWPFERESNSCRVTLSKSPIPSESPKLTIGKWIRTDLSRQTLPGLFYHATFITQQASQQAMNWALSGMALLFLLWILIMIIRSPRWNYEIQKSQAFRSTVESFLQGDFKARPRIFAHDHDAPLEQSLDQLGSRMPVIAWHIHQGRNLNLSIQDLERLETSTLRRKVTLSRLIFDSSASLKTIEKIEKAILHHNGVVLNSSPHQMIFVWDCNLPTEAMNPAYAVMAAVQLRSQLPIEEQNFLIALDLMEVDISATPSKQLFLSGETAEDFHLLKAAHGATEILITEDLAQNVQAYFVLSPTLKRTANGRRLLAVEGYLDTEENPVLIKSGRLV